MSRATISTGAIQIDTRKEKSALNDDSPMYVAILGDFSGRSSRGLNNWWNLSERRIHQVDRDNFEELFEELNVTLALPVADEPVPFREFDDLHPDYLYDHIALFDELRTLKRKLHNPEQLIEAAMEIQQWVSYKQQQLAPEPKDPKTRDPKTRDPKTRDPKTRDPKTKERSGAMPAPGNLLDAILQNHNDAGRYTDSPAGNIDQLIKDIVAPYVTAKTDPRLPELEAAVDCAAAELMRKIMHASHFQALEAGWRSLYMLVRRLETNSKLKLFLLDISKEEITSDIHACESNVKASGLYKLLVENNEVAGGTPYAIINADYFIEDTQDDLVLASMLADIGQAVDACVVAGGSLRFAGCENLASEHDPDDWCYRLEESIQKQWRALREQPGAAHLALAAPRFLLRLPYGRKTSPIDSFDFEELSDSYSHDYYLWGNTAWLVTFLLAQSYSAHGWSGAEETIREVAGLPLHAYSVEGESVIKPPAEVVLVDRAAGCMMRAGLLPVRSVKNSNSVLIPDFMSVNGGGLQWGRR